MVVFRSRRLVILLLFFLWIWATITLAQTQFTGTLTDDNQRISYPVILSDGETIRAKTEATSGNLDTLLTLQDLAGNIIIENDDIDASTTNSAFEVTVDAGGTYQLVVSNQPGTSGDFVVTYFITAPRPEEDDSAQTPTDTITAEGEGTFSGDIRRSGQEDNYRVTLQPGEGIYVIATGRSTLDTYLRVEDMMGTVIAENDDRRYNDFDSELVYISEAGGQYTVVLTNYPGSTGDYSLEIDIAPADELPIILRVDFSGPATFFDTEHFRIHYTLSGDDATTDAYIRTLGETMEDVWDIQINQMGWPIPPRDVLAGGDDRYDVYVVDLLNEDLGGDYGMAVLEPPIIESASASYVLLDNDYQYFSIDSDRLVRATAAHEFHHMIQFGYDANETHNWYLEATATWMETQTYPEFQDAVGYVEDVFTYPEVCFGAQGAADPTGGILMYGHWLFMQSLTDAHGPTVVQELWEQIAIYDAWEPLERVLATYDETITDAVARYHLQNLVRDYALTDEFEQDVVWQEDTINSTGLWQPNGDGIQELGANYYAVDLPAGAYTIEFIEEEAPLQGWIAAIDNEGAQIIALGEDGVFSTEGFDYVYLMVLNTDYDNDVDNCNYADYRLRIITTDEQPDPIILKLDSSQFKVLD